MRVGLSTLDNKNRIALFNAPAEQILGYQSSEVIGKACDEIFVGLADKLVNLHHEEGKQNGDQNEGGQIRHNALSKDGNEVPLITKAYASSSNGNSSTNSGTILVFQDAHELEAMENRLQHLDRLKSLDEFAAGIVHEIRNPLAGISTNAQYILEKLSPSDRFHEEMRDILEDVKDIEGIVGKILDFAHPSRANVQIISVNNIVNEVLRFSRMLLRRRGIQLVSNFIKADAKIKADVSQIKQVLLNVIRNAYDVMPKGGQLRVSTAHLPKDKKHICIAIEDTGRGIAEELLERIFDPFFSMNREGTGLGLAISRKIVERHGGSITAQSEQGEGSKFEIILPVV